MATAMWFVHEFNEFPSTFGLHALVAMWISQLSTLYHIRITSLQYVWCVIRRTSPVHEQWQGPSGSCSRGKQQTCADIWAAWLLEAQPMPIFKGCNQRPLPRVR